MNLTFKFDDDFTVNRLGFGTMQLPGTGVWGPADDEKKRGRCHYDCC